jgi:hypothetical protein
MARSLLILFLCRQVMDGRQEGPSPALLAAQRRLEQLRAEHRRSTGGSRRTLFDRQQPPDIGPTPQPPETELGTVKIQPDLALGMLQQGVAAAGRVWLLLRHLDGDGRGWLALDQVQDHLTGGESPFRICGRRNLRVLLQQGRQIFWLREKVAGGRDRLWLKSTAKVALALGVGRLGSRPVDLPLQVLLSGMGQVRAHFYATFHSGRKKSNPISRSRLEEITQVPARSQRCYDRAAKVTRRDNIAVGERFGAGAIQERAWRHGRAVFQLIDHHGRLGPKGNQYVAWRLPNNYEGPHDPAPIGRQKKINQEIDLVNRRAQGNDLGRANARFVVDRLFHPNGAEAGRTFNRRGKDDAYWPAKLVPAGVGSLIWLAISPRDGTSHEVEPPGRTIRL